MFFLVKYILLSSDAFIKLYSENIFIYPACPLDCEIINIPYSSESKRAQKGSVVFKSHQRKSAERH